MFGGFALSGFIKSSILGFLSWLADRRAANECMVGDVSGKGTAPIVWKRNLLDA